MELVATKKLIPLVFSLFLVLFLIRKLLKNHAVSSEQIKIELIFDSEFQSRNNDVIKDENRDYDDGDSGVKFYDEPYVN